MVLGLQLISCDFDVSTRKPRRRKLTMVTLFDVSVSSLKIRRSTNSPPNANMPIKASFCLCGSCSDDMDGIGKRSIKKSVKILNIEVEITCIAAFQQPLRVVQNDVMSGKHEKTAIENAVTPYRITRKRVIRHASTMRRPGKRRMYCSTMDNLVKVVARM